MVVRELTGGVHTAGFILTDILYKLPFFFFLTSISLIYGRNLFREAKGLRDQ